MARGLADGYRALADGQQDEAATAFRKILEVHGEHPQARAGLKQVKARLRAPRRAGAERLSGRLALAGEELPVSLDIDTRTLRYEEAVLEAATAARLGMPGFIQPSAVGIGPARPDAPQKLDLIVLHPSGNLSAREHMIRTRGVGVTTHFLIDWDGRVYQTLDLGMTARHTGDEALDARSVAVTLVNPLEARLPPLPPEAEGSPHVRELAPPETRDGKVNRHWGYTRGQHRSLSRLLNLLANKLPDLPDGADMSAGEGSGADGRGVLGVHDVNPERPGPGSGLDWKAIRRALQSR